LRPTRQNEGDREKLERLLHLNTTTDGHDFAGGNSLAILTVKHIGVATIFRQSGSMEKKSVLTLKVAVDATGATHLTS
jgi:hypothetical protein